MKIRLLVVLLALAGLAVAAMPAAAANGDITWERYDVTVDIREDGTAHVTESIDVRFDGSYRRGHRSIPMARVEGIENVEVFAATEGAEPQPATFTTKRSDGDLVIDYQFEPTGSGATRTIVLEYDVLGVIRVYPDNDPPRQEIRWTAISPEVTEVGPVREASATITFPEAIEGSEATRFDPEPSATTPTSVTWTKRNMGEGDSLMTLASFPAITGAAEPAWQERTERLEDRRALVPALAIVSGIAGTVGFGLLGLSMWRSGIRDPEVGVIADILPTPPDDLPAAHVGTLVDENFGRDDMLAMLIDLDRRGVVRITEEWVSRRKKENDPERFHIHLEQPLGEAPAWALPMLTGLFGKKAEPGKSTTFERLKKLSESHMSPMSRAIEQDLFERGYFEELPKTSRSRWYTRVLGFGALFALPVMGLSWWGDEWSGWVIGLGALVGLLAVGSFLLASRTARKSVAGAEAAAKWKAFGRYLEQMQREMEPRDRLALIDSYLPWAIPLGYNASRWKQVMREDDDYQWGSHQYRPWDPRWREESRTATASSGGPGGGFSLQGMSNRSMSGITAANVSMFAMLNSASSAIAAGSRSSSSGSGSGSASTGSSGGGGHSFS